jgi:hypothetical protein
MNKASVIQTLASMPENFSLDELINELILVAKINEGIKQSEEGKINSTAEAKEKLKKWLK